MKEKTKKVKEDAKEFKEKYSNVKEIFRFRSVWMGLSKTSYVINQNLESKMLALFMQY